MIGGEKTDRFRKSDVCYNHDALIKSRQSQFFVIPVNTLKGTRAGIQLFQHVLDTGVPRHAPGFPAGVTIIVFIIFLDFNTVIIYNFNNLKKANRLKRRDAKLLA